MLSTGFPGDSDPRDEEQDPEVCECCGEDMEWEDDAEYDPEVGRVVRSGGSFCCTNKGCKGKQAGDTVQELKNRMRLALEVIDEHVACANTRNKLKGLLYADTR